MNSHSPWLCVVVLVGLTLTVPAVAELDADGAVNEIIYLSETVNDADAGATNGLEDKPKKEKKAKKDKAPKADKPKKEKKAKAPKSDEVDKMAEALSLTPEQVTAIRKIKADAKAAEAQWNKENKDKLASLKEEAIRAKSEGNKELEKTTKTQMKELSTEKSKIRDDAHAQFLDALTAEQRSAYHSDVVLKSITKSLRKAELTDEQHDKIKTMIKDEFAKDENQDLKKLSSTLRKQIAAELLTDEQVEKVTKKKSKAPKEKDPS